MTSELKDSVSSLRSKATSRHPRHFDGPKDNRGATKSVSDYYGELTFDFKTSEDISDAIKRDIVKAIDEGRGIKKEHAEAVAKAVTTWAVKNGATHFCHWFQPLTGGTAEKHDAFFQFDKNVITVLKVEQN